MGLTDRIAKNYLKTATMSWDQAIDLLDIGKNPTAKDVEDLLRDLGGQGPVQDDVAEAANFVIMNMGENTVEGQEARGAEFIRDNLQNIGGNYYSLEGRCEAFHFTNYGWALCEFSLAPFDRIGLVKPPKDLEGLILQPHWKENTVVDSLTEASARDFVETIRKSDTLVTLVRESFKDFELKLKLEVPDSFRKVFLNPLYLSKLAEKAAKTGSKTKRMLWPFSGGKPEKV